MRVVSWVPVSLAIDRVMFANIIWWRWKAPGRAKVPVYSQLRRGSFIGSVDSVAEWLHAGFSHLLRGKLKDGRIVGVKYRSYDLNRSETLGLKFSVQNESAVCDWTRHVDSQSFTIAYKTTNITVNNELSQRLVRYCSVEDATLEGAVCCRR